MLVCLHTWVHLSTKATRPIRSDRFSSIVHAEIANSSDAIDPQMWGDKHERHMPKLILVRAPRKKHRSLKLVNMHDLPHYARLSVCFIIYNSTF